ncbi:ribonucleoside-diphosphate reductase, adenosylcobalamin-dependent [Candidatus Woesearchaeota archaeon ex4484_78]|nr:MAG: ribonucleoside-diphosphate reductase, adenosylcobalamin-dependent [Candidatus Woesearchaeota archaeon ex4484_78]
MNNPNEQTRQTTRKTQKTQEEQDNQKNNKHDKQVKQVIKRDGTIVPFDKEKIVNAIWGALREVGEKNKEKAVEYANKVVEILNKRFDGVKTPTVEEIQDIVENVLIEEGHAKAAKAYILYRQERKKIREYKEMLGVKDELKLSINSVRVLESRYLLKDEEGKVIESTAQLFRRVAKYIALPEVLYFKDVYDKNRKQKIQSEEDDEDTWNYFKALGYNNWDYSMIKRAFHNLNQEHRMRISFKELIHKIKEHYEEIKRVEDEFYELTTKFYFLPNSPTLMNASTRLGQLSACFVLPVGDSIPEIFESVKNTAIIHQSGGGTGFSFSRLRPKGDIVSSTKGVASGPLSFMRVFDVATEVIKQGGKRRGANMGILRVDHPDILEFITSKDSENRILSNFNISVAITDKFMRALKENKEFELINPRTKKPVTKIQARKLWDMLIYQAWKTGDPGVIFIDRINKHNQTPHVGQIESTNPCGEQPLLNYESCNLGSVNLSSVVTEDGKIDWDLLKEIVEKSVHFLDNVIDANNFPLPQIERMTRANRKIGLGVMGWAEMLIKLGIRYDSEEAIKLAEKVMKFITNVGREKSVELAKQRGSFPNFKGSVWDGKYKELRNATITTIAPTGTISIIAGTSSGVEPLFAIAFLRKHVLGEAELVDVNPLFERMVKEEGLYTEELMREIADEGTLTHIKGIPKRLKELFVTAHDIEPEWHVRMQAAFQKYTDNAVSKTINLRNEATILDVEKAYKLAYELGCKGITIYRDRSKTVQVIHIGLKKKNKTEENKIQEQVDYPQEEQEFKVSEEKCPVCGAKLYFAEGCYTCMSCGYSKCG